eukprot:3935070-Rhodomonas_salina.2
MSTASTPPVTVPQVPHDPGRDCERRQHLSINVHLIGSTRDRSARPARPGNDTKSGEQANVGKHLQRAPRPRQSAKCGAHPSVDGHCIDSICQHSVRHSRRQERFRASRAPQHR